MVQIEWVGTSQPECNPGCTYPQACNYNPDSNFDDGSCDYCFCGEGTQWVDSLQACMVTEAALMQACGEGTYWDDLAQACLTIETCQEDLDGDGVIGVNDLLELLSSFGSECVVEPETAEWTCGDPINYHDYNYNTILIGGQCWFAENLRATESADGELLEAGTPSTWPGFQNGTGAWMHPNNDPALLSYGRLYNWHATAQGDGMCPSGWHLPSDEEWKELELQLGIDAGEFDSFGWHGTMQGTELKSSAEWNGTDTHGFSALPSGGVHADQGHATSFGSEVWFWSSTTLPSNDGKAMFRSLSSGESRVQRHHTFKNHGASIRCLKD